jgi:hypothetical protein
LFLVCLFFQVIYCKSYKKLGLPPKNSNWRKASLPDPLSKHIVGGLTYGWHGLFDAAWYNFCNLVFVSFHNSTGNKIKKTTMAANPAILLPVVNGAVNACLARDVHFVRITCTVNFTGLVMIPNPGPSFFSLGFYIKLPNDCCITERHNVAYNLTTWQGVTDISMLTNKQVCMQILDPCLYYGPIVALHPANFNLSNAHKDTAIIHKTILTKILKLGIHQICASIFAQTNLMPSSSTSAKPPLVQIDSQ